MKSFFNESSGPPTFSILQKLYELCESTRSFGIKLMHLCEMTGAK